MQIVHGGVTFFAGKIKLKENLMVFLDSLKHPCHKKGQKVGTESHFGNCSLVQGKVNS